MSENKIDVVVLTKNNEDIIEICLRSIVNAIPVNNLIIIDGYSSDKTVSICEKFTKNIFLSRSKLAKARYEGAIKATTEWIAFVDSDVILRKEWFEVMKREMKEKNGYLLGLCKDLGNWKTYSNHKIRDHYKYGAVAFSNAIIRRKLIIECDEFKDKNLHAGEDQVFRDSIIKKNYEFIIIKKIVAYHYQNPLIHDLKSNYRGGKSKRLYYENKSIFPVFKSMLLYLYSHLKELRTLDLRLPFFYILEMLIFLFGFIKKK